jgi:3-hydroxyacyl-[acyl-carrier-protein] dehydratase
MRFHLIDRILDVEPGKSIRAEKNLTLGEEYLADHFPTFPVMPGVMMLQALVEAGAWLLRVSDDFRYTVVVLREAKNVKYGAFMQPGFSMTVTAELLEQHGTLATLKGKGEVDGNATVSARFTLDCYNPSDRAEAAAGTDERLREELKNLYHFLRTGTGQARQAGKNGPFVR